MTRLIAVTAAAAGLAEVTWNPVTGCGRCTRCGAVIVHEATLGEPLRWRTPRMAHVGTGDIGYGGMSRPEAARMWATMALTARHTFEVPVMRPGRLAVLLASPRFRREVARHATDLLASRPWQRWQLDLGGERVAGDSGLGGGWTTTPSRYGNLWWPPWPLPNVWIGTSVADDDETWRATSLRLVPAAARFICLDPLLGPVPSLDLAGIDWVIAGAGSGRARQEPDLAWVRDLRDRCASHDIAFFFRRRGGRNLRAGGRELDGRVWDQVPVPSRQAA
jgi:protein gp37